MPKTQHIDVKQAFEAAKTFYGTLYPDRTGGVRLEEVEQSEDGGTWFITLGYEPKTVREILQAGRPLKTEYKIFAIDATTGKVRSMKIRNPGNGEH